MGRNEVEGDMMFADVDFVGGGGGEEGRGYYENGVSVQQQQMHRKHRRKKASDTLSFGEEARGILGNGDSGIVTPYQNGHFSNGYHYQQLAHRHSSFGEEEAGADVSVLYNNSKQGYEDYLSPHPPLQHLLLDEQQASVNNAITVAPSRTNLNDSNVFAGGRPTNNLANKRARNNNRHKHNRGRSRTPDCNPSSNPRLQFVDEKPHDSQSILNKIDQSIRKNFGDWDSDVGEERVKKQTMTNGYSNNGKPQRAPFFIPKPVKNDSDVVLGTREEGSDLNLPRLFKPYETEVTNSRKVLNDKSYMVCLSRDNEDPNSVLSQAKKTLSYVSGQT